MALPTPALPASKVTGFPVAHYQGPTRHRRRLHQRRVRRFVLVYPPGSLSLSEAGDIVTEWEAADGGTRTFSWTPWNEGSAVDVSFLNDELDIDVKNIQRYGVTLELLEEVA